MGAKAVIHAGAVLYPCSVFAAGARVKITAIPQTGNNITMTLSSEGPAMLR
jgi:hypothetical protein